MRRRKLNEYRLSHLEDIMPQMYTINDKSNYRTIYSRWLKKSHQILEFYKYLLALPFTLELQFIQPRTLLLSFLLSLQHYSDVGFKHIFLESLERNIHNNYPNKQFEDNLTTMHTYATNVSMMVILKWQQQNR